MSDFDNEELDRAIALSLAEEDERSVISIVDDKKSVEEEDGSISSPEDENDAVLSPEEHNRGSNEEYNEGKKVIGGLYLLSVSCLRNFGSFYFSYIYIFKHDMKWEYYILDDEYSLEEDEQLAKAIQESLNVNSPPRINHGNIFPRLPNFFQGLYR